MSEIDRPIDQALLVYRSYNNKGKTEGILEKVRELAKSKFRKNTADLDDIEDGIVEDPEEYDDDEAS